MTYSLLFAIVAVGMWIVASNLNKATRFTATLAVLSICILVAKDLALSWNLTFGLLKLSKDLLILGGASSVLLLARSNIFAQIGIWALGSYYLYGFIPSHHDVDNYPVDKAWEILVKMKSPQPSKNLSKLLTKYNLAYESFRPVQADKTELDNYLSIGIPERLEGKTEDIYLQLGSLSDIVWIEYNEKIYRTEPKPGKLITAKTLKNVNDPMSAKQWSMQALNMDAYFQFFHASQVAPAKTAKLFILDSGVSADHEDLREMYIPGRDRDGMDIKGHGTHCAGIAAATTNNQKGISSMSPGPDWVELHSIKVMTDYGFGTQKAILEGIIRAVDLGADVINMSLGAKSYQKKEKAYAEAIQYAIDNNVIIVAAAGNSNDDAGKYVPANQQEVITVTSINDKLGLSYFSNFIGQVSYGIAAPGENILSTTPEGKYEVKSGTSMAAPHVAGLAAVLKSINPSLNHQQIHQILEETGTPSAETLKSGKLINPLKAVKKVLDES